PEGVWRLRVGGRVPRGTAARERRPRATTTNDNGTCRFRRDRAQAFPAITHPTTQNETTTAHHHHKTSTPLIL
ncbi:unnamed protein product, partial [Ectocarpus sp. 12 AP-2014]